MKDTNETDSSFRFDSIYDNCKLFTFLCARSLLGSSRTPSLSRNIHGAEVENYEVQCGSCYAVKLI